MAVGATPPFPTVGWVSIGRKGRTAQEEKEKDKFGRTGKRQIKLNSLYAANAKNANQNNATDAEKFGPCVTGRYGVLRFERLRNSG